MAPRSTITVTDNRTGHSAELPIENGSVRSLDLRQFKADPDDFGLLAYDPAFMNTASCRSSITFIDGDRGILEHRGNRIEDLVGRRTYEDVAGLLLTGSFPLSGDGSSLFAEYLRDIPLGVRDVISSLPRSAHPMTVLQAAVAAAAAFVPGVGATADPEERLLHALRLTAWTPVFAAWAGAWTAGLELIEPEGALVMSLLEVRFGGRPKPEHLRAMDALMILHADHEQNCSTTAARVIGSSHADPYAMAAGAVGALSGPLHGGANEAVLKMLDAIEAEGYTPEDFVERARRGEQRLMGFGHRVYKAYDPRAGCIRDLARDVFSVSGENPKVRLAARIEEIALSDSYFADRKLFPNVDFYSGILYEAMGFRREELTCLFAAARMSGWMAHWLELRQDSEQKIARPRQIYVGERSK